MASLGVDASRQFRLIVEEDLQGPSARGRILLQLVESPLRCAGHEIPPQPVRKADHVEYSTAPFHVAERKRCAQSDAN